MGLELLWEAPGLPAFDLPTELSEAYGGTLGFEGPCLFANFVQTIDGIVAVPSLPGSNKLIADSSATDRFVMGLLRACADVVLVGSGTLAASPRGLWTPEQAYPDAAPAFAELRRRLGKPERLEVAILSRSGDVDLTHPAFAAGAELVTADSAAAAVALLREQGHELILSEGGPHAIGSLLAAGLVDELFLTVSPLLFGRIAADPRLALVEATDLLPEPTRGTLTGIRKDADHLFLRYALAASAASAAS